MSGRFDLVNQNLVVDPKEGTTVKTLLTAAKRPSPLAEAVPITCLPISLVVAYRPVAGVFVACMIPLTEFVAEPW